MQNSLEFEGTDGSGGSGSSDSRENFKLGGSGSENGDKSALRHLGLMVIDGQS